MYLFACGARSRILLLQLFVKLPNLLVQICRRLAARVAAQGRLVGGERPRKLAPLEQRRALLSVPDNILRELQGLFDASKLCHMLSKNLAIVKQYALIIMNILAPK